MALRTRSTPLLALLLAFGVSACGGSQAPEPVAPKVDAPAPQELGDSNDNARELIATTDEAGALWLGWLRHSGDIESGEVTLELRYSAPGASDEPGASRNVTIATGPALGPASMAPLGRGVYLVWEARAAEGRALFGRAVEAVAGELRLGPLETVPRGPANPLLPHLAALVDGSLGLVWQALDANYYRAFFARRSQSGSWSAPRAVTPQEAADVWRPRLAVADDGRMLVAYDRFVPGSTAGYDVLLATAATPDAEFRSALVAGGPTYQGFPELGVDASGRAWVAYEEAPSFGQGGALRARRHTRLVAVDPGGEVSHAVLPRELLLEQRGDLPRLVVGPNGVGLTRRQPRSDYKPRNPTRRPFYATWHTLVLTFDDAGRGHDVELMESDGDNENDSVLLDGPTGLQLLLATDRRSANFEERYSFDSPIENPWRVARFELGALTGFPRLEAGPPPPAPQAWSEPAPQGLALADRNPRALFGDLHRHTNLSRCAGRMDGTFLDAVRYARGPGALDFLSVTDHFQHLTPWSHGRQLRDVERWDAPGSLALLAGYERMLPDWGHQNLVFDSVASQRAASLALPPKQLPEGQVVAIPHMTSIPANPFDWTRLDPEVQRLIEVHQGLRGSYEGLPASSRAHVQRATEGQLGEEIWPLAALDGGASAGWITSLPAALGPDAIPPGLISASDHTSSGQAFAGIPLEAGAERRIEAKAIFAALHARRTFATTGPAPGVRGPHDVRIAIERAAAPVESQGQAADPAGELVVRAAAPIESQGQTADPAGELVVRAAASVESQGQAADPAGELVVRAAAEGLVSITIVENGEPIELEAAPAGTARRLLVQTHFGMGKERRLTLRPENAELSAPVLRFLDPELTSAGEPTAEGLLLLDFVGDLPADADLAFHVETTGEAPAALVFELADHDDARTPLSLRFELEQLETTGARRLYLRKLGKRPFLDLIDLGADITSRTTAVGNQRELRWSLAGRPPGAIYYARVTWSDGNVAWTRMLR